MNLVLSPVCATAEAFDWSPLLRRFITWSEFYSGEAPRLVLARLKQWLKIAGLHGNFSGFDEIKRAESVDELLAYFACGQGVRTMTEQ